VQQLVLVRHALAEPAVGSVPDTQRGLRPEGVAQARAAGQALASLRTEPHAAICSSPTRRCLESAAAIARELLPPLDVEPRIELAEAADHADLRALAEGSADGTILVGHQPQLVQLAAALVGGGAGGFEMRPGSFLLLARDGPGRRHRLVMTWQAPVPPP
jgi:phosphohistidine phosphatase SixA